MKLFSKFLCAGFALIALLNGCANNDLEQPNAVDATDEGLSEEAMADEFSYYQNGDILSPASESPHGSFKLKFNAIAQSALDNGELPLNESFPQGSVLVKEVYQNSTLVLLAVMKKLPADPNAGSGWLWAEYQLSGVPLVSLESNGNSCVNCHNGTPNRDLVRTFDLH